MAKTVSLFFLAGAYVFFFGLKPAEAASFSVNPTAGTFFVGSTFDISLSLDTEGQSVNALETFLSFPPDKLQLVSPATGKSIIGVWTSQPKFSNQTGTISLQGGIPGGLTVSNGLISTLTFRASGVGEAILKFLDGSKILLNDGLGTDDLKKTQNGVYKLVLPPPAGPVVASETHPNETKWYSNSSAVFDWAMPSGRAESYSYVLNGNPADVPDNISEGNRTSVTYRAVSDGKHYFHIKSFREGVWGGVSNFAVNVDTAPPADFRIEIIPFTKTVRKQPIIRFLTTDALSGMERYQLKIVSLSPQNTGVAVYSPEDNQELFIEAQSPYVPPPLEVGDYDVIVRAYDTAGNMRETVQRLEIKKTIFQFVSDKGIQIMSSLTVPWLWIYVFVAVLIILLIYAMLRIKKWHSNLDTKRKKGHLPEPIRNKLNDLKKYRQKYGKFAIIFLIMVGSVLPIHNIFAAQKEIAPPYISTVSRNISNEEIFYIGGRTDKASTTVIIYLQNLQTGETFSETAISDKRGEWFYRHPTFLSTGNYFLWAQAKSGEEVSPPSPQVEMAVRMTALQFGSSRISLETLYLLIAILLLLAVIGLIAYISFHALRGRKKHKALMKEVKEAEESVRRGFAVVRRDMQAELALVKKAKLKQSLSNEEKEKEAQLLKDLDAVEKYIGKEIWDIEENM